VYVLTSEALAAVTVCRRDRDGRGTGGRDHARTADIVACWPSTEILDPTAEDVAGFGER
jgi:hypothetical protein